MKKSGFTLIELLVVVSVIAILATMTLVVIGIVRERASRAVCANNLRQLGIGDAAYANNWDGDLMLRNSANIDGLSRLANNSFAGGGGAAADDLSLKEITDYFPGRSLFCPQFYFRQEASWAGGILPPGTKWSTAQKNTDASNNWTSYAWYRGALEQLGFEASEPGRGSLGVNFGGKNGAERRDADLRPSAIRMGEFFTNRNNYTDTGNSVAAYTGWWHLGSNGTPAGGNNLFGDLHVEFCSTFVDGYALSFPVTKP